MSVDQQLHGASGGGFEAERPKRTGRTITVLADAARGNPFVDIRCLVL